MNKDATLVRDVAASMDHGNVNARMKLQLCDLARRLEDAPGGPWDTEKLAREMAGDPDAPVGNLMIDTMEAWILRAVDRLKGDDR